MAERPVSNRRTAAGIGTKGGGGIERTINAEGGISGINLACTRMRQKKQENWP